MQKPITTITVKLSRAELVKAVMKRLDIGCKFMRGIAVLLTLTALFILSEVGLIAGMCYFKTLPWFASILVLPIIYGLMFIGDVKTKTLLKGGHNDIRSGICKGII